LKIIANQHVENDNEDNNDSINANNKKRKRKDWTPKVIIRYL